MGIRCRRHERGDELLVAACDEELLGETFREGELKIEVKRDFYDGESIEAKALGKLLDHATVANLTGEMTVQIAIDLGFVDAENVLTIDGVPHAQFAEMTER